MYVAGDPVFADTWKYAQTEVGKGLGGMRGGQGRGGCGRREKENEKEFFSS